LSEQGENQPGSTGLKEVSSAFPDEKQKGVALRKDPDNPVNSIKRGLDGINPPKRGGRIRGIIVSRPPAPACCGASRREIQGLEVNRKAER